MSCHGLFRTVIAAALAFVAVLAGCKSIEPPRAMYGIIPSPEHPTVRLVDFNYTPASPIRVGDTLALTAKTNLPISDAAMHAYLPAAVNPGVELRDDGQPPDLMAGDGIWSAERVWTAEMGEVESGPVWALLEFSEPYRGQELSAPSLTVLPAEEE